MQTSNIAVGKIDRIRIKNFMSIRDAELIFDDSNIISLCGYNDSGKSAITRLMEVMFYNAYPTDQVKFITDGEEFWEGEIIFTDGVSIRRVKYLDGKSEFEMKKNGKVIFTNRLDNGSFAAMGDIPDKIKDYLGVIQDEFTQEKLNVRRNTDKLFLINTTGGDNYKILNSVLQSDMLAETSKRITEDKNKLKAEVTTLETKKDVISNQILDTNILPDGVVLEIKDNLNKVVEQTTNLSKIRAIGELKNTIDSIQVYDELSELDLEQFIFIESIANAFNSMNISVLPEIESLDTERLEALISIADLQESAFIPMYDEVESLDMERYELLLDIGEKYKSLYTSIQDLNKVNTELTSVRTELEKLSKEYNLKVCGNCGSIV